MTNEVKSSVHGTMIHGLDGVTRRVRESWKSLDSTSVILRFEFCWTNTL